MGHLSSALTTNFAPGASDHPDMRPGVDPLVSLGSVTAPSVFPAEVVAVVTQTIEDHDVIAPSSRPGSDEEILTDWALAYAAAHSRCPTDREVSEALHALHAATGRTVPCWC